MLKKVWYLFLVLLIWLWIFYLDFFLYKDLKSQTEIDWYLQWKYEFIWLNIKKNLLVKKDTQFDSFIVKNDVDIPINKLLFYQKEYWKIPNITCDDYTKLKLQRNYIIEPTYEDKANILKLANSNSSNDPSKLIKNDVNDTSKSWDNAKKKTSNKKSNQSNTSHQSNQSQKTQ